MDGGVVDTKASATTAVENSVLARSPVLRRIAVTGGVAAITFGLTALLGLLADISFADQVTLAALVGCTSFLAQVLLEFEGELVGLRMAQQSSIVGTQAIVSSSFSRVSEATRIYSMVEESLISTPGVTRMIERSGELDGSTCRLARELVDVQVGQLADFLRDIRNGTVLYEGEDREWLLALTEKCEKSISATSLATVDAGNAGFEDGLWESDLGIRYLQAQRTAALDRGVEIRRLFIFNKDGSERTPKFSSIRRLQEAHGVQVRVLTYNQIQPHLVSAISDFIVFDGQVGYETSSFTRQLDSNIPIVHAFFSTRLVLDGERVRRRVSDYEDLWNAASDID